MDKDEFLLRKVQFAKETAAFAAASIVKIAADLHRQGRVSDQLVEAMHGSLAQMQADSDFLPDDRERAGGWRATLGRDVG